MIPHVWDRLGRLLAANLNSSISTALMRPRRPKQYCLQLVIYIYICTYISTWIFEKVAPEDLPILAGTTPKAGFLDSHEPRNHTGEKREGRGERGEEKRTAGTHNFYIAYFAYKKVLATHRSDTSTERYRFQKSGYIYIFIFIFGRRARKDLRRLWSI